MNPVLELARPFPSHFIKDDGRGNSYVPHSIVTQRLIHIFGCPPKIELLREIYDGGKLTGVVMRLTVPGFDSVEEAGEADNPQSKTNGARLKDASSDAIKRCLVAGTLIWTRRGQVPIESVHIGDEVMTRGGWRRVTDHGLSYQDAPTVSALLSDGTLLAGSFDHPIYVQNQGFVYLSELQSGAILYSWHDLPGHLAKKWSLRGSPTDVIADVATSQGGMGRLRWPFIGLFTKPTTGSFQRAGTFITSTGTPVTTSRRISSRLLQPLTQGHTLKMIVEWIDRAITAARPTTPGLTEGTTSGAPYHAGIGIDAEGAFIQSEDPVSYAARPLSSRSRLLIEDALVAGSVRSVLATEDNAPARNAENPSWRGVSGLDSAPVSVSSVVRNGSAPVWNLTVEDRNEFFANGVLTHNCAMRLGLGLHLWAQENYVLFDRLQEPSQETETQAGSARAPGQTRSKASEGTPEDDVAPPDAAEPPGETSGAGGSPELFSTIEGAVEVKFHGLTRAKVVGHAHTIAGEHGFKVTDFDSLRDAPSLLLVDLIDRFGLEAAVV